MRDDYVRYRVAWVPSPGTPLARFGAAWTGWCPDRGHKVQPCRTAKVGRSLARAAETPGRRGLHAPLTPAFRLAKGVSRYSLALAIDDFALCRAPVVMSPLVGAMDRDGPVLAPSVPSPRMVSLMAELRTALDGLVELRDTGWPRAFALPLAGKIGPEVGAAVLRELSRQMQGIFNRRVSIGQLALMGQSSGDGPWRVVERYQLSGGPEIEGLTAGPLVYRGPALLPPRLFAEAMRCVTPEPETTHV